MSIKAVLFDLGKVLIRFDFDPAFRRLSPHCGRSPARIRDFFASSELEVLYDGGKLSSRDFYSRVRRGLGFSLSYAEFRDIWNDIFTPVPGMDGLVRRLARSKRLVLVSNTNAMHFAYLRRRFKVLRRFDRHVLSFREKVRKPDPRIYRRARLACNARPHEIFYIDDRPDLTAAAKELGFHVYTFKNDPPKLRAALQKQGVL